MPLAPQEVEGWGGATIGMHSPEGLSSFYLRFMRVYSLTDFWLSRADATVPMPMSGNG